MWNLGQVVQHKVTGQRAIYAGFETGKKGLLFLTPTPVRAPHYHYTHLADPHTGRVDFGKLVHELDLLGYYFGSLDLDALSKLPESGELIKRCIQPQKLLG